MIEEGLADGGIDADVTRMLLSDQGDSSNCYIDFSVDGGEGDVIIYAGEGRDLGVPTEYKEGPWGCIAGAVEDQADGACNNGEIQIYMVMHLGTENPSAEQAAQILLAVARAN